MIVYRPFRFSVGFYTILPTQTVRLRARTGHFSFFPKSLKFRVTDEIRLFGLFLFFGICCFPPSPFPSSPPCLPPVQTSYCADSHCVSGYFDPGHLCFFPPYGVSLVSADLSALSLAPPLTVSRLHRFSLSLLYFTSRAGFIVSFC